MNLFPWRHNERDGVSSHQPYDCLPNGCFRRRQKKTSKLRVTGLCAGNSLLTGEFPAQRPVTRKMVPFDDVIVPLKHSNTTPKVKQYFMGCVAYVKMTVLSFDSICGNIYSAVVTWHGITLESVLCLWRTCVFFLIITGEYVLIEGGFTK